MGEVRLVQPTRIHPGARLAAGDLYIHRLPSTDTSRPIRMQVWIFLPNEGGWVNVLLAKEQRHPALAQLVLSFSKSGDPSWVKPDTERRHSKPHIVGV